MDRRQFAIATAAVGGRLLLDPYSALRAAATQNADALSPAYAESAERQPAPFGFAWTGGETIKVKAVKFALPGERRAFTVELEGGRRIDGETRTIRTISTPVEGQRRPSATVAVTSTIGDMIGHINDWSG